MAKSTDEPGREELLAENRARRAQLRADADAKADRGRDNEDDEGRDHMAPSPESTTGSRSRWLTIALTAVVAVLVIAVGVLGWLLARAHDDAAPAVDRAVIDDAKNYASTVLTYSSGDYGDLDKRIREISTPAFADRYIKSSQQARQGNDEAQAKGTAEAKEAGLISLSDSTAVVLVAMDQNVKTPLVPAVGQDGMSYQSRLKITLTRDGDDWKLSDLSVV